MHSVVMGWPCTVTSPSRRRPSSSDRRAHAVTTTASVPCSMPFAALRYVYCGGGPPGNTRLCIATNRGMLSKSSSAPYSAARVATADGSN